MADSVDDPTISEFTEAFRALPRDQRWLIAARWMVERCSFLARTKHVTRVRLVSDADLNERELYQHLRLGSLQALNEAQLPALHERADTIFPGRLSDITAGVVDWDIAGADQLEENLAELTTRSGINHLASHPGTYFAWIDDALVQIRERSLDLFNLQVEEQATRDALARLTKPIILYEYFQPVDPPPIFYPPPTAPTLPPVGWAPTDPVQSSGFSPTANDQPEKGSEKINAKRRKQAVLAAKQYIKGHQGRPPSSAKQLFTAVPYPSYRTWLRWNSDDALKNPVKFDLSFDEVIARAQAAR